MAENKAKPDPKTTSNATRINDQANPNPAAGDNSPKDNGQAQPDPKTVSNATRVKDQYRPNPDGSHNQQPQQYSEWNEGGNPVSKKNDDLDPSSDQPPTIQNKENEDESKGVEKGKKIAEEGGDKDISHATIGKEEEKEAKEQNKDKKQQEKDSKKSDNKKSDNKNSTKASNNEIETETTTKTTAKKK
jgi:hypothetical protein